jgi:adenine-specific DNA methylase
MIIYECINQQSVIINQIFLSNKLLKLHRGIDIYEEMSNVSKPDSDQFPCQYCPTTEGLMEFGQAVEESLTSVKSAIIRWN